MWPAGHTLLACCIVIAAANVVCSLRYSLILDSGSTGTRIYAHTWQLGASAGELPVLTAIPPSQAVLHVPRKAKTGMYERVETQPGLSHFVGNPAGLGSQALGPLLDWARAVVPPAKWTCTPIFFLATAGLRKLGVTEREQLMMSVRLILANSGFRFHAEWARIITGAEEGAFGWVSANYLAGSMQDTHALSQQLPHVAVGGQVKSGVVLPVPPSLMVVKMGGRIQGTLDLGGSSLEVTYLHELGPASTMDVQAPALGSASHSKGHNTARRKTDATTTSSATSAGAVGRTTTPGSTLETGSTEHVAGSTGSHTPTVITGSTAGHVSSHVGGHDTALVVGSTRYVLRTQTYKRYGLTDTFDRSVTVLLQDHLDKAVVLDLVGNLIDKGPGQAASGQPAAVEAVHTPGQGTAAVMPPSRPQKAAGGRTGDQQAAGTQGAEVTQAAVARAEAAGSTGTTQVHQPGEQPQHTLSGNTTQPPPGLVGTVPTVPTANNGSSNSEAALTVRKTVREPVHEPQPNVTVETGHVTPAGLDLNGTQAGPVTDGHSDLNGTDGQGGGGGGGGVGSERQKQQLVQEGDVHDSLQMQVAQQQEAAAQQQEALAQVQEQKQGQQLKSGRQAAEGAQAAGGVEQQAAGFQAVVTPTQGDVPRITNEVQAAVGVTAETAVARTMLHDRLSEAGQHAGAGVDVVSQHAESAPVMEAALRKLLHRIGELRLGLHHTRQLQARVKPFLGVKEVTSSGSTVRQPSVDEADDAAAPPRHGTVSGATSGAEPVAVPALVKQQQSSSSSSSATGTSGGGGDKPDLTVLHHPCLPEGYSAVHARQHNYGVAPTVTQVKLVGTGKHLECHQLALTLVTHSLFPFEPTPASHPTPGSIPEPHTTITQPPSTPENATDLTGAVSAHVGVDEGVSAVQLHGRVMALTGFYVVWRFFLGDGVLKGAAAANSTALLQAVQRTCSLPWTSIQSTLGHLANVEKYCLWGHYVVHLLGPQGLKLSPQQVAIGSGDVGWPLGAILSEVSRAAPDLLAAQPGPAASAGLLPASLSSMWASHKSVSDECNAYESRGARFTAWHSTVFYGFWLGSMTVFLALAWAYVRSGRAVRVPRAVRPLMADSRFAPGPLLPVVRPGAFQACRPRSPLI